MNAACNSGDQSHAEYPKRADRLGERELAVRRRFGSVRLLLGPDWQAPVLQTRGLRRDPVGAVVCRGFRILDLLPARPAAADIARRAKNDGGAGSNRAR